MFVGRREDSRQSCSHSKSPTIARLRVLYRSRRSLPSPKGATRPQSCVPTSPSAPAMPYPCMPASLLGSHRVDGFVCRVRCCCRRTPHKPQYGNWRLAPCAPSGAAEDHHAGIVLGAGVGQRGLVVEGLSILIRHISSIRILSKVRMYPNLDWRIMPVTITQETPRKWLGCVDGFNQHQPARKTDDC